MVNTCREQDKCFICKQHVFDKNRPENHYQQYHPISMNEGRLPNRILPCASWDHPEPSLFQYSRCIWMAIDKLSINDLLMANIPGASQHEDSSNEEPIDPQQPDLICTADPTKTKAHRQVVGVDNAWRKAYGRASKLYNKHHKYSAQWNPWHPFRSAHDIQHAQSFSQQMESSIDQRLRCGLDNFKIESFQSADALGKLLSELDFGPGNMSCIEDDSHIFGTLYYSDIFKCIQLLLAHLPFQAHLNCELLRLADSVDCWIYRKINTGDEWWDTQDQFPARAMILPVICACDKTYLTKISGDQDGWPLDLTIANIRRDVHQVPKQHSLILVRLIPRPQKGGGNIEEAWHTPVGTVLSQLRHLDITGPGFKRDCADGFQRQCYPLLVAWVGDYPEQVLVAQVSYGSCPICGIPKDVRMGHSTLRSLDNSRSQHISWDLLVDINMSTLHSLGVHPIRNQFSQYPLCNVYWLWKPDELHLLLMGFVKDLLNWLLKYLKAWNVKNQLDNQFTSVPPYPDLQHFSKPFDSLKSGPWQGTEICEKIRSLAVNCTPLLVCSNDDGRTAAEMASDGMVMAASWACCESSLLVSQQNHSDISLRALHDALKRLYKTKGSFERRKWRSLRRPKQRICSQRNRMSDANKWSVRSVLQWRPLCMGLKRFPQQTIGNLTCAGIEPDMRQPLGQMLIISRQ